MKLTQQQLAEARKVYDLFWDSYQTGDIDTFAATLDDNFEMIGTSESERCHTKTEGIEFYKGQVEEVVGKAELRNRQIRVTPLNGLVLVNELSDIYILVETEWTIYSKIRISTLLRETSHGWKVAQQHGSLPDMRVEGDETMAIDKISRENIELRDAVKRRTAELVSKNRELEIEAALEKVRFRSLAMHNSNELNDTVAVFHQQLQLLDIDSEFSYIWLPDEEKGNHLFWATWTEEEGDKIISKNRAVTYPLDKTEPSIAACYVAWESSEPIHVNPVSSSEVENYFATWSELLHGIEKFKPEQFTEGLYYVDAYMKYGCFGIVIRRSLTEDEKKILARFTIEFERTYTRFLDLKKAEEQAREAQIEASLERVRAKAMSMQNSDELDEVLSVLCEQFDVLGILPMSTHMTVFNFENNTFTFRETGKYGDRSFGEQTVDLDAMDTWKDTVDKWKADRATDVNSLHFPKETLPEVWDVFHESFASMPEKSRITPDDYPDGIYHTAGKHPFGYIGMNQIRPATEEEKAIVIKFANEFGRAYQRFLDLQKAEEQAREAQIEAALERVRTRTMAMHRSAELGDVAAELFAQMNQLVTNLWTCGFVLCEKDRDEDEWWLSMDDGFTRGFFLPNVGDYTHATLYEGWLNGDTFRTVQLKGEALQEHYEWLMGISVSRKIFEEMDAAGLERPDWQKLHAAYFSRGYLVLITREPCGEEEIFKRFAQVFEQTYTRFLDLKKAEAQAIEATKQASLDRVRGEIASMRSAKDLERITPLVWRELTTLGIPFIRCGVFIIHEEEEQIEVYLSKPDGASLAVMHLPFDSSDLAIQTVESWRKGNVYTQHWSKEDFLNWGRTMVEQGQIPDLEYYQGAEEAPESLHLHFIPFNQGMLYVGATEPLSDNEIDLTASLSEAFAIAYARYEDFVKLEKAKENIEAALSELKATQSQLVQQEKLASLGQLTAGIAHEIKNPLNFVNNFSEVSMEMIEEALGELGKVKTQHAASEQEAIHETELILKDIKSNLSKIHEHGTRADSIVKSMLMHSRGGSGQKEPTDINELIREYVNLTFHGMRAGMHPISVQIDLKLDETLDPVPVIVEDLSRVIINLCNNAFDAMRSKLLDPSQKSSYTPKLTVRTKRDANHAIIEIEDNGPGIPEGMKDKILQPFFTTKKGTEGTGLGLSITNDIVKAHGGKLKLHTVEGEGSVFSIHIPITN